jgi:hypothetical protein
MASTWPQQGRNKVATWPQHGRNMAATRPNMQNGKLAFLLKIF